MMRPFVRFVLEMAAAFLLAAAIFAAVSALSGCVRVVDRPLPRVESARPQAGQPRRTVQRPPVRRYDDGCDFDDLSDVTVPPDLQRISDAEVEQMLRDDEQNDGWGPIDEQSGPEPGPGPPFVD